MFKFIKREKANHSVTRLCRVLDVSTSGYYAWQNRKPSKREREDAELQALIVEIHQGSRGTYGAPRIHAALHQRGIRCSKKRVSRLMRKAGIEGISRRNYSGPPRRKGTYTAKPDLVERRFVANGPNMLWVADITQHMTREGWLYIAIVIDVFSRKVVGWAMGNRATATLVVEALNMAIRNRNPDVDLVHHSDHGVQYTSLLFGSTLRNAGIMGSMGTVGDALDNALAESFNATLETELLNRRSWATRRELTTAVFEYIEVFYNRQRLHSSLGYLSPVNFEREWDRQQKTNNDLVA